MGCTKAKRRRQEKISAVAGVVPTVPTVADHCTNGWLATDIYKGEIFINTADNKAYTRGDSGIFQIGGSSAEPYLVYTAALTQTGANAPTATVLRNTLGGTVVWTRDGAGTYSGTLSGAFTLNKTVCFVANGANGGIIYASPGSANVIALSTFYPSLDSYEDMIFNASIEIRVYP